MRQLLFGGRLDRAIQRQAFEIDHLQLAGIVVGYEQRLTIRRVSELARKCAGRHTSKNRRWPGCDVRGINYCQGLASISVARKAVRVTYEHQLSFVGYRDAYRSNSNRHRTNPRVLDITTQRRCIKGQ